MKLRLLIIASALIAIFTAIPAEANCSPNPGGDHTVTSNCSFSGTVNGVEGGNLTVNSGVTLTINASQTIVFNPGKSVTVNGTIAMSASGATLKQTRLWMSDADFDGTPTDTTQTASDTDPGNDYRSRDEMSSVSVADTNTGAGTSTLVLESGSANFYFEDATIGADGLPIALYTGTSTLSLFQCGNLGCSSGNTSTTIMSVVVVGTARGARIATGTDGFPVVALQDATNGLRVVKCGNASCSSGNSTNTVDSHATSTVSVSLAIGSDGYPILAYQDIKATSTYNSLFYAKCGNASCSSGNIKQEVVSNPSANTGLDPKIMVGSDGNPIVAYEGSGGLSFLKCTSSSCASASVQALDSTTKIASGIAMTLTSSSYPLLAHVRDIVASTSDPIVAVHCLNTSCSGGTNQIIADDGVGGGPGLDFSGQDIISIEIASDSKPIIAYKSTANSNLYLTKCGNWLCNSGNSRTTLTSQILLGATYGKVLIGSDDLPIFFHGGGDINSVGVLKCGTASCQ